MQEEVTYIVNDITRNIRHLRATLERIGSDEVDQRIKAMINTKLQEAELLSLLLIKEGEPHE